MLKHFLLGLSARFFLVHCIGPDSQSSISQSSAYSLPQFDKNPTLRAQEVSINHAGFLYGPPLIGNNSFFPGGKLGSKRVASDVVAFKENAAFITQAVEKESGPVIAKITKALDLVVRHVADRLIVGRRVVSRICPTTSFSTRTSGVNRILLVSLGLLYQLHSRPAFLNGTVRTSGAVYFFPILVLGRWLKAKAKPTSCIVMRRLIIR